MKWVSPVGDIGVRHCQPSRGTLHWVSAKVPLEALLVDQMDTKGMLKQTEDNYFETDGRQLFVKKNPVGIFQVSTCLGICNLMAGNGWVKLQSDTRVKIGHKEGISDN